MLVEKVRERLPLSKRETPMFNMERFDLKKLEELEVGEQYKVKIRNRLALQGNLDDVEGIIREWENKGCPTRYRTRHFFNNFTRNEDIATKFEADYRHVPLHFSHNERTPVQISLQYLHWC